MGSHTARLTSLTQWSKEHIQRIFESPTDHASMRAVEETFAHDLDATVNGKNITLEDIKQSVLSIRSGSNRSGLRVQWHQTVEAPTDPTNEQGSFGGTYSIEGIWQHRPGDRTPTFYTRHKTVIVRIEPRPVATSDSRKIVHLAFVAADIPKVEMDEGRRQ